MGGLGHAVVEGQPALHFHLADTASFVAPQSLKVAALDLTKPPMSKDALVPLHVGGHQVLMTVRRKSHATMTSQATKNVSLSEDVHGERVVFKQSYGALQHIFPEIPDQVCEPINVAEVLAGEVPLAKALSFMLRLGT